MAQVSLKHVSKVYNGRVRAVDRVSLGVENKEFLVLVGPSGCGKSTTLRMIAGLELVTEGEIYIGNRLVNDVPAKDRDIAMVFQNYALYPHMTVFENMAFGLMLRRFSKSEIKRRVHEGAEILGIKQYLDRKPRELSGGERQRVAVGRAIVRKPMVFLFDEPLSNLDAKLRVQMRTELNKLHLKLQTTMIYVTHDQTEAMTMGDRIVVMKEGVVQQIDDPIDIYDSPINKFVASFIGSPPMNFMKGRISVSGDNLYFNEGNFRVRVAKKMQDRMGHYVDKNVILGIRSENIHDKQHSHISATAENVVRVTCEVVEPVGSEVYLYLNSGKNTFIARVGSHHRPAANQKMDLIFDINKVHFFNADTEVTIV